MFGRLEQDLSLRDLFLNREKKKKYLSEDFIPAFLFVYIFASEETRGSE